MPSSALQANLQPRSAMRLRQDNWGTVLRVLFLSDGFADAQGFLSHARFLPDVFFAHVRTTNVARLAAFSQFDEPGAGGRLMGSGLDSTGRLSVDLSAVELVMSELKTGAGFREGNALEQAQNSSGVTTLFLPVILCPDPGNRPPQARRISVGDTLERDDLTSIEATFDGLILEIGAQAEVAFCREVGHILGLSREDEIPTDPDFLRPGDAYGAALSAANLVFKDSVGRLHRDGLLDILAAQGGTDLGMLVTEADAADPDDVVTDAIDALWKGGGGYREGLYRTAHDCMMRRRFQGEVDGLDPDPLLYSESATHPDGTALASPRPPTFCPACRAHLARVLNHGPAHGRGFDDQKTHFDQAIWSNGGRDGMDFLSELNGGARRYFPGNLVAPAAQPETHITGRTLPHHHFWSFSVFLDTNKGLVLEDMRDHRNVLGFPATGRQIAEHLEFRDMGVVIARPDGTQTDLHRFDISDATITSIRYGEDGTIRQDDHWRHGFQLIAEIVYEGCRITIEQSVCLRGPMNDFDPTKAVVALKCYPELAFSYEPEDDSGNKVVSFHGCVWQNVNPKSEMVMHAPDNTTDSDGHHAEDPRRNDVFTSWFGEIRGPANPNIPARMRLQPGILPSVNIYNTSNFPLADLAISPTISFYTGIFAYWRKQENPIPGLDAASTGDAPEEREVLMVRHFTNPRTQTTEDYSWRGADNALLSNLMYPITLQRKPREGQYDNVHNHGWMGEAIAPVTGLREPMRMAPVCGQACVHLHTRWLFGAGLLNVVQNMNRSEDTNYWGWGDHPIGARAHTQPENPLVPPNQRVRVAVTSPGLSDRVATETVFLGTTATHGTNRVAQNWSTTNRGLWYDVDIVGHISPGTKHVIFEQGWGYAADHAVNTDAATPLVAWEPIAMVWLRRSAYFFGYDGIHGILAHIFDPFEKIMMFNYNCWQFHLHGEEQIPEGNYRGVSGTQTAMEDF